MVNSDVLQKQIDIKYFKINRLKKENNKDKELKERISLSKILEKHNYIKQYLNNLKRIIVLSKVSEKYESHVKTIEELYNYYKNEKEINYSLLIRTGNLLLETYNNCSRFYLSEPLCIELIPFFKLNCQKNKRQYNGHFLKFLENTFLLLKHQTICLDKEYFELFGNFINHCDGKKLVGSSELQEKSLTKLKELYAKNPKEWEAYYIEFLENLK